MKSKLILLVLLGVVVTFSGTALAAIIPGGDFQMYKPGTSYTVTAVFPGEVFDNYAQGVGDNLTVQNGGVANYSDDTTGGTVDLPGWVVVQGGNDVASNGVDGSTGLNVFASWGGQCRRQTAGSLGTITEGNVYTISAMVSGPVAGGPLAFELWVDDGIGGVVALTPSSSSADPIASDVGVWQVISRTFDAGSIAGHIGESMSIVIGVTNANTLGDRMVWDNVSLEVPEPATMGLLALGGLAVLRRRRK